MALATQCPHCHTSFRVANDQLKLHAGLVRCGQCQQTFNGIENLLTPDGSAATTVSTSESSPPTPAQNIANDVLPPQSTEVEAEIATEVATEESIDLDESEESDTSNTTVECEPDANFSQVADNDSAIIVAHASEEVLPQDANSEVVSSEKNEPLSESKLEASSNFDSLDFDLGDDEPTWSKNEPNFPQEAEITSEVVTADAEVSHENNDVDHAHIESSVTADDVNTQHSVPEESHEPAQSELTSDADTAQSKDIENAHEVYEENEDESEKPNFVLEAEKKQRAARWQSVFFSFLILIFVLSGLAQSVYFFRSTIAANFPATKAPLLQVCQKLKCQIKLPAQKEFLEISGKELQNESAELHLQVLTVQMQNNSSTLQAWPMLELVLQDARQKPLLQRAFAPSEYLEDKTMLAKGIPANSEQNIKIYFENASIKANNFTVDLFYP